MAKIRRAIEKSYDLYLLALDHGMKAGSAKLAIKVASFLFEGNLHERGKNRLGPYSKFFGSSLLLRMLPDDRK